MFILLIEMFIDLRILPVCSPVQEPQGTFILITVAPQKRRSISANLLSTWPYSSRYPSPAGPGLEEAWASAPLLVCQVYTLVVIHYVHVPGCIPTTPWKATVVPGRRCDTSLYQPHKHRGLSGALQSQGLLVNEDWLWT